MKRDDDGLLTYTKVTHWYSGDTINMDNGEYCLQLCWFISNK